MKKNIFLIASGVFFLLITLRISGQGISTLSVYPSNPTTVDSVRVIASVWLPSGDCWLEQAGVSVQDHQINVYAGYDAGMLTVICNSTDTVNLGAFDAGTYTCSYNLIYPYYTSVIDDIMSLTFTVSGTSSSETYKAKGADIVCYLAAGGNYCCKYLLPPGEVGKQILIYDPVGRMIYTQPLRPVNGDSFSFSLCSKLKMIIVSLETSGGKRYNRLFSL